MNIIIDIDALRKDLINYFGTAMQYNKIAMMDLIKVENASDSEIVNILPLKMALIYMIMK